MTGQKLIVLESDVLALTGAVDRIMANMQPYDEPMDAVAPAPAPPVAERATDGSDIFVDEGKFYDFLRGNDMLGPKISVDEFTGCDTIIRACHKAGWGISWVAYALATAYHETAHTMLPIKEIGGNNYYHRMYDIQGNRPAKARELGNLTPGDGIKYPGRGYPQTTGKSNYAKATAKLRELGFDIDLVANPDEMMRPDVAAATMVSGMEEGWFTSRKLPDDLPRRGPGSRNGFVLSRDIINGRDDDDLIAGYAVDFQTGLQAGGYREPA